MKRANAEQIAWVLRVHNVGKDAARRSMENRHYGWTSTLAEARAILDSFTVLEKDGALAERREQIGKRENQSEN